MQKIAENTFCRCGLVIFTCLFSLIIFNKIAWSETPSDKQQIKLLGQRKDAEERLFDVLKLRQNGEASKETVHELIKTFENDEDDTVRCAAAEAIGKAGPEAKEAIPALIFALENDESDEVREEVALALIKIGPVAKETVSALTRVVLNDQNGIIRYRAAEALEYIALDVSEKQTVDMIDQLKASEKALKGAGYEKIGITVKLAIDKLESIMPPWWEKLLEILKKHPQKGILCLLYIIWVIIWLLLFWRRPLKLIPVNTALKEREFKHKWLGGIAIPLRYFLFVGFLYDRTRVIDAWVRANVISVRQSFIDKETVKDREIHISIPVEMGREIIKELEPKHLRPVFKSPPSCLLIWGEGGAGKTSLACKIAKWAMSEVSEEKICLHTMIPILIEQELDANSEQPFTDAIKRQLQILTKKEKPVGDDLLERLLRQRRILVIVDRLSEMSESTRNLINLRRSDFSANAMVVTSRLKEKDKLGEINIRLIKPLKLQGNRLSTFIDAYLNLRNKRDLFDNTEFFDISKQLSSIVSDREITVLMAKLYAEHRILVKEASQDYSKPDNIPDLMIEYVNWLNQGIEDNRIDDFTVHRDAKLLAWECIRKSFRPGYFKLDRALEILVYAGLTKTDAKSHLDYLEKRLRLIQLVSPSKDRYHFTLDPLSEYLAGLYLVEHYATNEDNMDCWHSFLEDVDNTEGLPDEKKGFLLALRDCCIAKKLEFNLPGFLEGELAKRAAM